MQLPRYLRPFTSLFAASLFTSTAMAADLDNQDIEALRDWINSKRLVTVKELGGQLSISGDVHAEYQSSKEIVNGKNMKRYSHNYDPPNVYDIEFNLSIDYRAGESTWAAARVRFDNDAGVTSEGIGTGRNDKIKVDRAYFGYRIYDQNRHTTDIELGRRPMSNVFESKIEFNTNFDGALFKDSYAYDSVGDFYYQIGVFMINERKSQPGYAGEIGLQNIAGTGFYGKYSIIDWDTRRWNKAPSQFDFIISQLILGYKFIAPKMDKITNFYLAGLLNHRARPMAISAHKKANAGGYAGVTMGQIKVKGDWSFDANYQVVQAQSIPSFDVSGIGMGNTSNSGFYYSKSGKTITENTASTPKEDIQGNVNYRGFELTLQYLLTNNLNIFQQWKQSITLDDDIGPFRRFRQYEIDFIYLF